MSSSPSHRSSIVSSGEMSLRAQCSYSAWKSFSLTDSEVSIQSHSRVRDTKQCSYNLLRTSPRIKLDSSNSKTSNRRRERAQSFESDVVDARLPLLLTASNSFNSSIRDLRLRTRCSLSSTDSETESKRFEQCKRTISVSCPSSSRRVFYSTGTSSAIMSLGEMILRAQCSYSACESFSLNGLSLEEMSLRAQCSFSACESFSLTDSSLEEMSLEAQCSSSACKSFFLNALETSSQSQPRLLFILNSINSSPRDLRLKTQCSLSSTDSLAESKSLTQTLSTTSASRPSLLTLSSRPTVFRTQLSSTASVFTSNIRPMSSGSLALPANGERLKIQQMVEGAFNKFVELGQYLGGGTFGKVYKARDRSDFRKEFLVKIMARNMSGKNEIDIMQKINGHPNVVEILGHGSNSQYYHVFMSLDGTWSFYKFCKKFQAHLSEITVRYFFNQMTTAVDHLHSLDVAHLDIKPSNMVINDTLQVKLIDFGLSKDLRHEGRGPFPGHYGTCIFMAAEMLQGRYGKCYPKPADIWSLGVTLFTCVFGYYPFDISADGYIKKRTSRYFTTPMNYMPELKDLLDGMLNYSLADRYDIYHVRKHNWCQGSTNFDINNFLMQPKKKTKTIQLSSSHHSGNYVHINVSSTTAHLSSYKPAMSYLSYSMQANVSSTSNCAISSKQQLSRILNTKANNNQDMIDSLDNSVAPTLPLRQWVLEVPPRPMSAPGKLYSRTPKKTKPLLKTSTSSNTRRPQLGLVEKKTELEKKSEKRFLSNQVLSKSFKNSIVSETNALSHPTNDSIVSTTNALPQQTNDSIVSTNNALPQPKNDSIVSTNNALPQPTNDSIVSTNNALPQQTNDSIVSTNNALPQPTNDLIVSTNNALPHPTNDSIVSTNNALPQQTNDSIASTNNALPQSSNDSIVSTNNALPQQTNDSIVSTNNALPQFTNDLIVSTNNALPHQTIDSIVSTDNALPQQNTASHVNQSILKATRLFLQGALALYHGSWPKSY